MKNRFLSFILIIAVVLAICSCGSATTSVSTTVTSAAVPSAAPATAASVAPAAASKQPTNFSYVHDPHLNQEAMKDIVENPYAVYGFSPDPKSTRLGTYASYDWTDPAFVATAKEERKAYHDSLNTMVSIMSKMAADGASEEEIARAVSAERNRLRLDIYKDDPKLLAEVKDSNLKTYGNENGPSADELYKKYGSWSVVIQKAFSPNLGMDVICGLYDEYYPLYVMLGYAY